MTISVMQSNKLKPPPLSLEFYPNSLTSLEIDGKKFSLRRIDILATFTAAKKNKERAELLGIKKSTFETQQTHIGNMLGAGGALGNITKYIKEKRISDALIAHYKTLELKYQFEKQLKEIANGKDKNNLSHCSIEPEAAYQAQGMNKPSFLNLFTYHLNLAGIKILEMSNQPEHYRAVEQTLYFIDDYLIEQIKSGRNVEEILKDTLKLRPTSQEIILILQNPTLKEEFLKTSSNTNHIDFTDPSSYFSSFVKLLEKMIPGYDLTSLKSIMDSNYLNFKNFSHNISTKGIQVDTSKFSLLPNILHPKRQKVIGIALFAMILLSFSFWTHTKTNTRINQNTDNKISLAPIRSELIIPSGTSLLNRQDLMKEIEKKFKGGSGIQTVALVGMGGAGKTTLARHYARQQKSPLIWEINAETKESLISSFENLAYALARTKEAQNKLKSFYDIKNINGRQTRILSFVKEQLRANPDWLLVYDNIEIPSFVDFKDYFPQNPETWGKGQVLFTTRNSTIKNVKYLDAKNIVDVGSLNEQEKLNLFSKIYYKYESEKLITDEKLKTIRFLKNLPPFPLDVSTSAYYLKDTQLEFDVYLEKIKEANEPFTNSQESLLEEIGEYKKTRYSIIKLTLKNLIKNNHHYQDLLLLISLLNSQDIPYKLLETYKSPEIAHEVIHNFKKQSLIMNEPTDKNEPVKTFSIHRSTQEIYLEYFKKVLNLKNNKHTLQEISVFLEKYLDQIIKNEKILEMKLLASHCERLIEHKNLFTYEMVGSLQGLLGRIHLYCGNDDKAKQMLEASVTKLKNHYGSNHLEVARLLLYLGDAYNGLGDNEKTKDLFLECIRIYEFKSISKDPDLFKALSYLGDIERKTGNYKKAQEYLDKSLSGYTKYYSNYYADIARTMVLLSLVYRDSGEYVKAESFLHLAITIYKKYYSKDHTGIEWAQSILSEIYIEIGEYKQAKELLEQNLKNMKKYYQDNHPVVARIQANLGVVHTVLGNYKKAEKLLLQSLDIFRNKYSDNHTEFAWVSSLFANLYVRMANYQVAEKMLKKSQSIFENKYGKDHFRNAEALRALGELYLKQNNIQDAEVYLRIALILLTKKNHINRYKVYENLSDLMSLKSRIKTKKLTIKTSPEYDSQSANYLKQALKILQTQFPKNSLHLARIQKKLKSLDSKLL